MTPQLHFNWRREALGLYRDILRASRTFTWKNEHGEVWGKVIAVSARVEFEQARDETVRLTSPAGATHAEGKAAWKRGFS